MKGFSMSRDLAKDKEKEMDGDTGECAISPTGTSQRHRPELLLSGLSSSGFPHPPSLALSNHPEILFSTHNSNFQQYPSQQRHSIIISQSPRSRPFRDQFKRLRGVGSYASTTEGKEVLKTEGLLIGLLEGFLGVC